MWCATHVADKIGSLGIFTVMKMESHLNIERWSVDYDMPNQGVTNCHRIYTLMNMYWEADMFMMQY